MRVIYNGTDITADVQPIKLLLTDNAGGVPDSITAFFSDTQGLWSRWRPAKNGTLQVVVDGYDTGVMYIDHLGQYAGKFEIKALSIPQTAKSARSQGWEEVRLLEIATEIASRHGFTVQSYDIVNHLYQRVDQVEEADFAFLAKRCVLEGYALKINGRSVVIYNERIAEQRAADEERATIRASDMIGQFEFTDKSVDVYGKCIVRIQTQSSYIQGEYDDSSVNGPTLTSNIFAGDIGEAQRWARGLLRSFNKRMVTGSFSIELNLGLAAGSNVMVRDVGLFDGKYFVHRLVHDLIGGQTHITVRQPLEGY